MNLKLKYFLEKLRFTMGVFEITYPESRDLRLGELIIINKPEF